MNLIWITPECPYPPNTGGKVGIFKRIQYMSKYNDIYLLTIVDNDEDLKYKDNLCLYCKEVHMFPRESLFNFFWKCIILPYPAVSRWNKSLFNKLIELNRVVNPKYIIVDSPQMMGITDKEILGKIVLNQHNIEYKTMLSLSRSKKNILMKLAFGITGMQMKLYEEKLYSNGIFMYTFVSNSEKKFFEKKYNLSNTLLVPVGTEVVESIETVNSKKILFIGKLSYSPNEEGILWFIDNVFNKILSSVQDAKLYILGKDPTEKILHRATVNKNIIITGPVESLDEYYKAVDLVIVPIFSGGGVNVKLIEAIGRGKIVVTTQKGLCGTKLIDGKEVYSADTSQLYADYCIDILNNPLNHLMVRENALKKAKEMYSWDKVICKFNSELENR